MKKLLCLLCLSAMANLIAAVTMKLEPTGIILGNEFIRVKIVPRGGKVASLYDKKNNHELLSAASSVYGGACKARDVLFQNAEPMIRNFLLEEETVTPEKVVIRAVYKMQSGSLAGVELIRTYTLREDCAYLEFKEFWRSHSKPNQLVLNWHNAFKLEGDAYFYLPSQRGTVELESKDAVKNRLNLISDPSMPWLAMLNRASGEGVALFIDNIKDISGMYIWGDQNAPTMEVNFSEVDLKPVVGADSWSSSGKIIPLRGIGHIASVSPQAVLSADNDKAMLYFPVSLGPSKITLKPSGETIPIEPAAGSSLDLPLAKEYLITTSRMEFSLPLTAPNKEVKPLTQMPPRKLSGVNGFYYFYPQMYLSDEISTNIAFGLRGDFSKFKNFRFVLTLPPGVELLGTPREILKENKSSQGTIYEIDSFRKKDFFICIPALLKLTPDFKPGSHMYLNASWEGGAQKPEKILIEKISPLPKIGEGLKFFKTFLFTRTQFDGLDWRYFQKIGVNQCDIWDYGYQIYHQERKEDNYYSPYIKALRDMGVEPFFQFGLPFSLGYSVMAGELLEGAGRLFHAEKRDKAIDINDLRCVNINGNRINAICPSYRGRYFEKCLDVVKIAIDYGFANIAYDEETWSNATGICYCPRCKQKYQEYLKSKEISASDEAFIEFKTDLVTDIYRQIRETLDTYKPKSDIKRKLSIAVDPNISLGVTHYGAIRNRLTDWRKLAKYADEIIPMLYTTDSEYVGDYTETAIKLLEGTPADLIILLSPNMVYEYSVVSSQNYGSKDVVREQIIESIFGGAKGVGVWNHEGCFRGAHDAYKFAQAVKMLMPVEEIIAKGKRVKIESSNPAVKVTAYEYNGELAVFARNYDSGVIRTQLNLPKEKRDVVFDKERITILKVKK